MMVKPVVAELVSDKERDENKTSQSHGKPGNVDERINLLF
jgi:hypothetical protein